MTTLTKTQIAILQRYAKRRISRADAARRLGGVSERQVNRMLKEVKLDRVQSDWEKLQSEITKRRIAKEQAARAFKRNEIDIETAARRAGCSPRTIYRYLEKI